MHVQNYLQQASVALAAITDNPALEAEVLLAHVLQQPRSYLYARPKHVLTFVETLQFVNYVQRRQAKEPIAYITGTREFWSLDLLVTHDTLIPRPETELLVEMMLDKLDPLALLHVADLGTGSGAIGLALAYERKNWHIYATDVSQRALHIASQNAQRLGIQHISFYQGDWCAALPDRQFDAIVTNPPYIAEMEWQAYAEGLLFEPKEALISGQDGLEAIRVISASAKHYLKQAGYLAIEHGFSQGAVIREMMYAAGYHDIYSAPDLAGRERVTIGHWYT